MHSNNMFSFARNGGELWCNTAEPPRRFDNMLFNERYFTMIDQGMWGYSLHMTPEGYMCTVVAEERVIYVRDDESGSFFSVGFMPVCKSYRSYRCGSGLSYQIVENETDGLKVTWRIYIPAGIDPVEIWDVRVENCSRRKRRISLFTEAGMSCAGMDLYYGIIYRRADYRRTVNAILVEQNAEKHTTIDFPNHNAFLTADRRAVSWTTHKADFLGKRGNLANPEGLTNPACLRRQTDRQTPTATLKFSFAITAGGKADTRLLAGACDSTTGIARWRRRYLGGNLDADRNFDALIRERKRMTGNIQIASPDASIEPLFNIWIKQLIQYGAIHSREGYKGYRDIVQQAQGVLTQEPERAREILLKACRHQYQDGFALRGWHPTDPLRYADSAQWMISAATEYVKETGNFGLLKERVPFFDCGSDTVYGHLMRAMQRLHHDRGAHGLNLIHFGDWNDSLTGVGRKGRGESVWLSMAFCRDALLMEELARRLAKPKDALLMKRWHKEMSDAINRHAWDGAWYLCALDDEGRPVGSSANSAGKIFMNMQSWAQLGRICSPARWKKSWQSVRRRLDTGWGLMLHGPTYTKPVANVGRLSYIRPGICENGSVYTHGNAFMLLALLERGLADDAWRLLQDIHPANPRRPMANQINTYFNGFFGPDAICEPGHGEHAWCTGSSAWIFLAVTEFMFGLRRTYDGLIIKPCLPTGWKKTSITRTFRGTTYEVSILNPGGTGNAPVAGIEIDGQAHPVKVPLPLDGKRHRVRVLLAKR